MTHCFTLVNALLAVSAVANRRAGTTPIDVYAHLAATT